MKKILHFLVLILFLSYTKIIIAQDDLLSILGPEEETTQYANASFKTNKVINLHSIENTAPGVLDFKIAHRFGFINGGAYEFFGLDQASMKLIFDYGITKNLQVGIGRTNFEKVYDGYLKYRLLHQSKGKRNMPISLSYVAGIAVKSEKFTDENRTNYFTSRLYYHHQLLIARKFSDNFTLQLTPSLLHRNLVESTAVENDVYSIAIAGRQKLTKRLAVNLEYIYNLSGQIDPKYFNSLSVGFDIETGGHVFQLHFTNSTSMVEKGFIAENTGDWTKGDIHFGFNLSRVFTLAKPKHKV